MIVVLSRGVGLTLHGVLVAIRHSRPLYVLLCIFFFLAVEPVTATLRLRELPTAPASYVIEAITPTPAPQKRTRVVVADTRPDYEVVYTPEGFNPRQLTVLSGETVAFRNAASTTLYIMSGPHPAHSDSSTFSTGRSFAPGETYQHTFMATGTISYHNEDKLSDQAYIAVMSAGEPIEDIDKTISGQRAVRDKLLAMLEPGNPDSIFKVIDTISADPVLNRGCHDIAHDLGHHAYELYGFSEAMTFSNSKHFDDARVRSICAGGYIHGVIEELSVNEPTALNTPDNICGDVARTDRDTCYHGLGHAYMFINNRDAEASAGGCRAVTSLYDEHRCFEGVRMEQFWGSPDHADVGTLGWDLGDPLAPCIAAPMDEKPTCFLYSPFGYLRTHHKDYVGTVNLCARSHLPTDDAALCLKGLGITMMSKFKGENLEGSEVYVAGLSYPLKYAFYQGVLGYAHLSGVKESELQATCALFKTDGNLCLTVLQEVY